MIIIIIIIIIEGKSLEQVDNFNNFGSCILHLLTDMPFVSRSGLVEEDAAEVFQRYL